MLETRLLETLATMRDWTDQALAEHLAIGTDDLCVLLSDLQDRGVIQLETTATGWRLRPPLDLLDEVYLQHACPQAAVKVLTVTDSTNSVLQRQNIRRNGDVVLSEYQSAGRGRHGRVWLSPFAGQIIMSMYWRYNAVQSVSAGLSVALGIAAATALRDKGFSSVQLKWPNDLYLNERKLGGILLESTVNGQHIDIVAGIGINLIPSSGVDQPLACLGEIGNIARNELAAMLIQAWRHTFNNTTSTHNLPIRWANLDAFYGRTVQLQRAQETIIGINRGIDAQGRILLESDGVVRAWTEGETRLRIATDYLSKI